MAVKEQCSNCKNDAEVIRGGYKFKESGVPVLLKGIEIISCPKCGNEDPIIPRMNELMRVIALAVIHKPGRLTGREVRFLRKYLRMTGQEFAAVIGVNKTTVSKWENDADELGTHNDRLIRIVSLSLGDGLEDQLRELIKHFPSIKQEDRKVGIHIDTEDMSCQYA